MVMLKALFVFFVFNVYLRRISARERELETGFCASGGKGGSKMMSVDRKNGVTLTGFVRLSQVLSFLFILTISGYASAAEVIVFGDDSRRDPVCYSDSMAR